MLVTHSNVYNDRIFDIKNIFFMAKSITTVLILTRSSDSVILTVYMYVGGLLNNVGQNTNIDLSNDVDNHVNLGLATM